MAWVSKLSRVCGTVAATGDSKFLGLRIESATANVLFFKAHFFFLIHYIELMICRFLASVLKRNFISVYTLNLEIGGSNPIESKRFIIESFFLTVFFFHFELLLNVIERSSDSYIGRDDFLFVFQRKLLKFVQAQIHFFRGLILDLLCSVHFFC